jgi:hypothetical protein
VTPTLDSIRNCFEGFVPALIATCDADGTPNVSLLSQVHYVDCARVALTYQFFNKTRRNVLATRKASIGVVDPVTVAQYRMNLEYQETQTSGPIFEIMKAKLAGIASHSGMAGVFRLLGSDIYRVTSLEQVADATLPPRRHDINLMSATRITCDRLSACTDLAELFDITLASLDELFGIQHTMLLMREGATERLYTVASRGYDRSGIGSEVALGEGVIGVAARERVPIRIAHMTSDYGYAAAIRESARRSGMPSPQLTEIPFPGLKQPHSQVALPILSGGKLAGVLFAESPYPMRFWYDHEDALAVIAAHLGAQMTVMHEDEPPPTPQQPPTKTGSAGQSVAVRHYKADDSIFLDHDYLIKGVAGAIFWKLVREHAQHGRSEFSNRELRLDPALRLPEHAENLEARLILLQRRLDERGSAIRIEKSGRGRFRLVAERGVMLKDVDAAGERAL